MRLFVFSLVMALGSGVAMAQTAPGISGAEPLSPNATNIVPGDTTTVIAPAVPVPDAGDNATARELLNAAHAAIEAHQTGMAQEALERAETRILTRSEPLADLNEPSHDHAVLQISTALKTLGTGDMLDTLFIIDGLLAGNAPELNR